MAASFKRGQTKEIEYCSSTLPNISKIQLYSNLVLNIRHVQVYEDQDENFFPCMYEAHVCP